MKTVGIIGGIGPETTIDYYRSIVTFDQESAKEGNYPQVIINSINMKKLIDLIAGNRLDDVTRYLLAEIEKLASASADFAVLASNTPHIVFDRINRESPLPMISIVEVTCERVLEKGLKRVGLFGTKFTMRSGFYNKVFSSYGIEVIAPDDKEQDYIQEVYFGELVQGIIRDETRCQLLEIASALKEKQGIQGLILGGTELSLIIKESGDDNIQIFDTAAIHVQSILKKIDS